MPESSVPPTTATLQREVAHLSERVDLKIDGLAEKIAARLDAIDKATKLFEDSLTRVPTETDKAVGNLKALAEEKFAAVEKQFKERDTRVAQQVASSQQAVDAALQAAKEAVAKSEVAQIKAIEQLGTLLATARAATEGQINDAKDRITRIEAIAIGQAGQKGEQHMSSSMIISIVAVLLTLAGMTVALLTRG
jgi:hypothetical protein